MFYSYNLEKEKTYVFSLFIESIISGNTQYESDVKQVLENVKDFLNEKKTIYSIDCRYLSVILYLAQHGKDFLKNLDIDNIQSSDYLLIDDILQNRSNLSFA